MLAHCLTGTTGTCRDIAGHLQNCVSGRDGTHPFNRVSVHPGCRPIADVGSVANVGEKLQPVHHAPRSSSMIIGSCCRCRRHDAFQL